MVAAINQSGTGVEHTFMMHEEKEYFVNYMTNGTIWKAQETIVMNNIKYHQFNLDFFSETLGC